jgi:hypothetical protein
MPSPLCTGAIMFRTALAVTVSAILALGSLTVPAIAATDPPAKTTKRAQTPGQIAFRDRQKKCGAEWKEAKAANKVPEGMKWPKFWSACNTRLKAKTP